MYVVSPLAVVISDNDDRTGDGDDWNRRHGECSRTDTSSPWCLAVLAVSKQARVPAFRTPQPVKVSEYRCDVLVPRIFGAVSPCKSVLPAHPASIEASTVLTALSELYLLSTSHTHVFSSIWNRRKLRICFIAGAGMFHLSPRVAPDTHTPKLFQVQLLTTLLLSKVRSGNYITYSLINEVGLMKVCRKALNPVVLFFLPDL